MEEVKDDMFEVAQQAGFESLDLMTERIEQEKLYIAICWRNWDRRFRSSRILGLGNFEWQKELCKAEFVKGLKRKWVRIKTAFFRTIASF